MVRCMLVQIEIVIDLRFILDVIRTRDLWIRSPVRYPLRYEDCFIKYPLKGLPRSDELFRKIIANGHQREL